MSLLAAINASKELSEPQKRNILVRLPSKDIKTVTNRTIILDLDETLIHTQDGMSEFKSIGIMTNPSLAYLRSRIYKITLDEASLFRGISVSEMWGVRRPYLKEFLIFCFSYFRCVAIWTAGITPYAEAICKEIFNGIEQPHFILSREECVEVPGKGYTKPISILQNYPYAKDYFDPSKILIVDDRATTAYYNPENLIGIPQYNPAPTAENISQGDPSLLQLLYWLTLNKDTSDVTTLKKGEIFTRPLSLYLEDLGKSGAVILPRKPITQRIPSRIPIDTRFLNLRL